MNDIFDDLGWEYFYKNSDLNNLNFPKEVKNFNRLICHTQNFFLIAGYGAFNQGYCLLIPKTLISSFAHLEHDFVEEFNWLRNLVKESLKNIYPGTNIAMFEHGLCGCMGGLDRAHLHFMPYNKKNLANVRDAVNISLDRRGVGDRVVKFANYELTTKDDIDFFLNKDNSENKPDKDKFVLTGKQFDFDDIKSDFKISDYPSGISKKVLDNNPYIYFDSSVDDSSFITFTNIETQFGREIIFNIDYNIDHNYQIFLKKNNIIQKAEKFCWRWQDYNFEENILLTIKNMGTYLNQNNQKIESNKFNFVSF